MRLIFALVIAGWCQIAPAAEMLSLAGMWQYQLDPADVGISGHWFNRVLTNSLVLPGSLPEQGIGDDISASTPWMAEAYSSWYTDSKYAPYREPGNVKISFFLQPEKYYAGPVWYQRQIEIPDSWSGLDLFLSLERVHWGTTVWVDGVAFGSYDSLGTPHPYDLGKLAAGSHLLSIRVDNRLIINVGQNASSVTDNTQGNWNGIVGDISLTARPRLRFEDVQVYPHVSSQSVTIKGSMANLDGVSGTGQISIKISPVSGRGGRTISVTNSISLSSPNSNFSVEVPLGTNTPLWDEFNPALFDLTISFVAENGVVDVRQVSFGLREIGTAGTQFVLNGHKIFFRGTLEACVFPNSGHPPTDADSWRRIIRIAKSHGLNLFRFHSWCPPEAAFEAADELGFYYQVECESWTNPGEGSSVDNWLYVESERILKYYGNHPSFLLMTSGNEPFGSGYVRFLSAWVDHFKAEDSRRLFSGASGFPQIPENQFYLSSQPRIQAWGGGLSSSINAQPPQTTLDYRGFASVWGVPVISHEIGQWCVYPNFDEIPKYTNYLKPKNLEIFRDFLEQHQMQELAAPFLMASGKLQVLCYKEEIESALRTPGMGGFELLGLHDFPGQGTALVGVLDAFWDEKPYITAAGYSRFCNSTVPLIRLAKRVFTNDETLDAEVEVAHFGASSLTNVVLSWSLNADDGSPVLSGTLPALTVPIGNGASLGGIHINLGPVPSPARYKLNLGLAGTPFTNDWDIWVYPRQVTDPSEMPILADLLTPSVVNQLTNGAKVLLTVPASQPGDPAPGRVQLGFSSIFWNTDYTGGQPPTTLGILCDPGHPLFKYFPTDSYSNWQWWYLLPGADAMDLDDLSPNLKPIVRVIDDWFSARRLGTVFEAKIGLGKLLVCSLNLRDVQTNIVARQFRSSLLNYMASANFSPTAELTIGDLAQTTLGIVSTPPVFVEPPQNAIRVSNHATTFRAKVSATSVSAALPLDYTWFHGRVPVLTGTSSSRNISLTLPQVKEADAGSYSLRVNNSHGAMESAPGLLTVLSPPRGSYLEVVASNNPVHYWRFDNSDNIGDFAGSFDLAGDFNMTHLNVAPSPGPVPPDFRGFSTSNTAAAYNGFDSGSIAPNLSIGTFANFTICGWFNPKTMPQPVRTALFGQNDFAELGFHRVAGQPSGALGIWVAPGMSVMFTNTDSAITAGNWYFVAVTANSTAVSLFFNGKPVGSAPGSAQDSFASVSPFRAGFATIDNNGNYFDGLIDEVAVFDHALSSDAISSMYDRAVRGDGANLLIHQNNGGVVLEWAAGTLQASGQVSGTFTNIPRAISPYTHTIGDHETFFRIQLKE